MRYFVTGYWFLVTYEKGEGIEACRPIVPLCGTQARRAGIKEFRN